MTGAAVTEAAARALAHVEWVRRACAPIQATATG